MIEFPQFISVKDRTIKVVDYIKVDNDKVVGIYITGKGYINPNDNHVWIYTGSSKPVDSNRYPHFWITDGQINFSHPIDEIMEEFSVKNLRSLNMSVILNTINDDVELYDEKAINDMNAKSQIFVPTMHEADDPLKKIIKHAIIEKNVDISRYKSKCEKAFDLSNMKQALNNQSKMSTKQFGNWAELLGIDYCIIVWDNGKDSLDKLKEPLVYDSYKDVVMTADEADKADILRKLKKK